MKLRTLSSSSAKRVVPTTPRRAPGPCRKSWVAQARSIEVVARGNHFKAVAALDRVVGRSLDTNGVPSIKLSTAVSRPLPPHEDKYAADSQSIQIHRGLEACLNFAHGLRLQVADSFAQFDSVQRGHLVAHGKARLRQTISRARDFNHR